MVTHLVKHITQSEGASPNRVIVSRAMGKVGGKTKPVRASAELKYVYEIDPANGDSVISHTTKFPGGKYDALDFIPNWPGHRFIGWFKNATSPSAAVPSMDNELTNKSSVVYSIKTVYAHWQLPTSVTFDANTNGGSMPDGWNMPDYYAGQPYGTLPSPTHETLNFTGWYVDGVKVTSTSIVPEGGVTLVAQFSAQSYSVDLNDAWRLEAGLNPDTSLYDGVYQSFANTVMSDGESMAKMYIDIVGYTHFRIYIASNSEEYYDYTVAMKPDVDPSYPPIASWGGLPEDVMDSTSMNAYADPSNISNYLPVDYELDGGAHRICIVFRKDSTFTYGHDCGYVLIPKEQ